MSALNFSVQLSTYSSTNFLSFCAVLCTLVLLQSVAVILPAPPVKSVRNPQVNVAASPELLDRCVIGVKVDSTTSQLPAVLHACVQPLQHQSSVVMRVCVPVLQMSPVTSVIAVGVASTI